MHYDAYLSHHRADAAHVKEIARELLKIGLEPFLADWHLIPGEPWQEALEAALEASRCYVAFVGSQGLEHWELEAMRAAIERRVESPDFRVIPVLLPESPVTAVDLPPFLRRTTPVDLRLADGLKPLIAGIRGKSPGPSSRSAHRPEPSRLPSASLPPSPLRIPKPTPYFTGREAVLTDLHHRLTQEGTGTLGQAIVGLGGTGKTQTALKYAQHFRDRYRDVFLVRAETPSDIQAGYETLAKHLNLPEIAAQDPAETVQAVLRWLDSHEGWLLIFDNADTPKHLLPFLPQNGLGKLLITSRAQHLKILGIPHPVHLQPLLATDALAFLLKRTGRQNVSGDELTAANQLAKELGFLPLALEQAGAFIEEQEVRFQDYRTSYRQRRLELLESQAATRVDARESVRTTWSMNFGKVAEASVASADFLRVVAFLAPAAIPLEIFEEGVQHLGPALAADFAHVREDPVRRANVLRPLRAYSLIEHDIEDLTVHIHPLVQEVLRAIMGDTGRSWVERLARALAQLYPWPTFDNWSRCDRLDPHAREVAKHSAFFSLETTEAAQLLNKLGLYAWRRARWEDAEQHLRHSLRIRETLLGPQHLEVARSLSHLAAVQHSFGRFKKAEDLYRKALKIQEAQLGPEDHDVAVTFNDLAVVCRDRGRYPEAEALFARSLEIWTTALGPDHPNIAMSLNSLANLYFEQERYGKAERFHQKSLTIRTELNGWQGVEVGESLNDLGILFRIQRRFAEAQRCLERSLNIRENELGPTHPDTALTLSNLADLQLDLDRLDDAEQLYQRSLQILEQRPFHHNLAQPLLGLARLHQGRDELQAARQLLARALNIRQIILADQHPKTIAVLREYETLRAAKEDPLKGLKGNRQD